MTLDDLMITFLSPLCLSLAESRSRLFVYPSFLYYPCTRVELVVSLVSVLSIVYVY